MAATRHFTFQKRGVLTNQKLFFDEITPSLLIGRFLNSVFYKVINCLVLEGAINVFILFIFFNMWVKGCLLKSCSILCIVSAFYEFYSLMTILYLSPLLISCQNKTLRLQNTMRSCDEKKNIVYISNLNNECSLPNCIGNRSFHLGFS